MSVLPRDVGRVRSKSLEVKVVNDKARPPQEIYGIHYPMFIDL